MVNKTYRIPHRVSKELLDWLNQQPNRISEITTGMNFTEVIYDHTPAESSTFLAALASRSSVWVDGVSDNANKYDSSMYSTTNPPPAGVAFVYAVKTSDQLLIGTAYTDVSGTGLAVAANTNYEFEFQIMADADAVTTGIDLACNGPTIGTGSITYTQTLWTGSTTQIVRPAVAYDSNSANTGSAGLTKAIYTVQGILRNGATLGTLIARIKREVVGTGPNVRAGSYGRLRPI